MAEIPESEWKTRKKRIDPKLDAAGWPPRGRQARRSEEEDTANGPADYALWLDGRIVGVVEAKKITVGPQNVLTQAERYARGIRGATAISRSPHPRSAAPASIQLRRSSMPLPRFDQRRGLLVSRSAPFAESLS